MFKRYWSKILCVRVTICEDEKFLGNKYLEFSVNFTSYANVGPFSDTTEIINVGNYCIHDFLAQVDKYTMHRVCKSNFSLRND